MKRKPSSTPRVFIAAILIAAMIVPTTVQAESLTSIPDTTVVESGSEVSGSEVSENSEETVSNETVSNETVSGEIVSYSLTLTTDGSGDASAEKKEEALDDTPYSGITGIVDMDGTAAYLNNGEVDTGFTGIAQWQDGSEKWQYVVNGYANSTYTGLAKKKGTWCYVKNGILDLTFTGMAKNQYGWWYVTKGVIDFTYTGMAKNQYGWWYMTKGKLDRSYTGIAKNQYGWWFMTKGKLDTSVNGWKTVNGKTYYFKNHKAVTGWQKISKCYYYFYPCEMNKNTIAGTSSTGYYYVGSDGIRVTDTAMTQAVQFIMKNSNASDTPLQRLTDCAAALRGYSYYHMSTTPPKATAISGCASYMFKNKKGNCYRFASSLCYIAIALGFSAKVSAGGVTSHPDHTNLSRHGWCDICIDGEWTIWDLSMARASTKKLINVTYSDYPYLLRRVYQYTYTIAKGKITWKRASSSWTNTKITKIC